MTAEWDDMALVGTVARAHGIRGQVVSTERPTSRRRGSVRAPRCSSAAKGAWKPVQITSCRMHRGRPVVGIAGVGTMTEAERLVGCELRVPAASLEPLPAGSLLPARPGRVRREHGDRAAGGHRAGSRGIVGSAGWSWTGASGEVLIPMAASICVSIDTGARTIVVDPPEGLLEVNRRRAGRAPGAA